MTRPGRSSLTRMCVLMTAAALAVSGKPHGRCGTPHDDYAPQYYLPEPRAAVVGPPQSSPLEYGGPEPAPCRSGRSNGRAAPTDEPADDEPADDVQAAPPPQVSTAAARHPAGHAVIKSTPLGPCKGPSVNETAPAAATLTVEKLTAYYDRLKAQQELLARRQLEVQLLEQQQRRHREYALVQQQIQQQYYQQQQHAMHMLDQLHKNPAFVSQLAAYMNQRLKPGNGTAAAQQQVPVPAASAMQVMVPAPDPVPDQVAPDPDHQAAPPPDPVKVKRYGVQTDVISDDDDGGGDDDRDAAACSGPVGRVTATSRDRIGRMGARHAAGWGDGAPGGVFDFADDRSSEGSPDAGQVYGAVLD